VAAKAAAVAASVDLTLGTDADTPLGCQRPLDSRILHTHA
jgi:hypothetical protein